jgi:hypothetical protein
MTRALLISLTALGCSTPEIVAGTELELTNVSRSCGSAPSYQRIIDRGACQYWSTRTFEWRMDGDGSADVPGDEEEKAIERAFQAWSLATPCSDWVFKQGPKVARAVAANDGLNQMVFRPVACDRAAPPDDGCWTDASCDDKYNCWNFRETAMAITTSTFNSRSGEMIDADIELNAVNYFFTTVDGPKCPQGVLAANCVSSDLQATVTHEIGHTLGLGHASGPTFSTMGVRSEPGDRSMRVIDASSACFVCDVYPAGRPARACQL